MRVACPHCRSESAHYVRETYDVVLVCLCGYRKVVYTELGQATITHTEPAPAEHLPRKGSRLWNCFAVLVGLERADTKEITDRLNRVYRRRKKLTVSEVASQLTVLRYRALVVPVEKRRGLPGGSVWVPTKAGLKLFKGVTNGTGFRGKKE